MPMDPVRRPENIGSPRYPKHFTFVMDGGDSPRQKADTLLELLDEWGEHGDAMTKITTRAAENLSYLRDVAVALQRQLMEAELAKNKSARIANSLLADAQRLMMDEEHPDAGFVEKLGDLRNYLESVSS